MTPSDNDCANPAGDVKTRKTVKYRPMKPERWTPHVTVAAIVERDGRFLVIEEHTVRRAADQSAGRPSGSGRNTCRCGDARDARRNRAPFRARGACRHVYDALRAARRRSVTYLRFTFCGTTTGEDAGPRARLRHRPRACGSPPTNCAPAPTGTGRRRAWNVSTITSPGGACRSTSFIRIRSRRCRSRT